MAGLFTWTVTAISATGYGGVIALMALESACTPLPSEIIMPFAGYLVSTGRFDLGLTATAGAIGCNIGSALAWWVGARGGRPAVLRWGRYVFLDARKLDRMDAFFRRHGAAAVFIGRMLPMVRTFISVPAGIAHMNFWRFQLYTFLGSWPWCFALAWIGLRLGKAWNSSPALHAMLQRYDWAMAVVIAGAVGVVLWRRRCGA